MINMNVTEDKLFDRVNINREGDSLVLWMWSGAPDAGRTGPVAKLVLTDRQAARLGSELAYRGARAVEGV